MLFRMLWQECKSRSKQDVEEEFKEIVEAQGPVVKSPSKKNIKKCNALIKLLNIFDEAKSNTYKSSLESLLQVKPSLKTIEETNPYICEEHLQDYITLLSDPEFKSKRESDWAKYT